MPYFIRPEQESGLLLAGLWDQWVNTETDEALLSFTILTAAANDQMEFVHHRQPVMLSQDEALAWLDVKRPTKELEYLFASRLPIDLEAVPISSEINSARNKEESILRSTGRSVVIAGSDAKQNDQDRELH